jgi:hypothetical protein
MPDRYIDGQQVSYYDRGRGQLQGRGGGKVQVDKPNALLRDDEFAVRIYDTHAGNEWAFYGYSGFWKSPAGQSMDGRSAFPRLNVYGASLRRPLAGGIGAVELGYYDSVQDQNGENPAIRNSEFRALLGYERELIQNLTVAGQWYLEHMMEYSAYVAHAPTDMRLRPRNRHVLTTRLTLQTHQQRQTWSVFAYWSPTDRDGYIRPKWSWQATDHVHVELGGNIFVGADTAGFFSQFNNASNVYGAVKYSF